MQSAHAQLQRSTTRRVLALIVLSLVVGVASCSASPSAVVVKLEVSEASAYLLNGQVIEPAALAQALRAARLPGKELFVNVVPAPKASYEAVRFAMAAVQQAGGTVGIVGNERF